MSASEGKVKVKVKVKIKIKQSHYRAGFPKIRLSDFKKVGT
jgi:hypothetical protein